MFTTETGIGVVVMVVFAAIWLAFMLWEDWGQAGKTARARASAKANGWEQDEMQNTITRNGAIIAYRLMTVGLFVVMLVDIIAFGKNVSEFTILWFVCMVFEGVYRAIATYRATKDDEENPPSKSALAGDIVKRIFIPVVIFADLALKMKNNIKELRKARGLRQEDMAKLLGVSRQTIVAMENDKYDPTLELAIKTARLLERPVEKIFFLDEES